MQARSSKLHVVIISQIYPPDLAGSATRAYNVAKGLRAHNARVTVVAAFPHYPGGRIPKKYSLRPLVVEDDKGTKLIRTFVPPLESKGFGRRLLIFFAFLVSSIFALPLVGQADAVFASNPQTLVAFPGSIYAGFLGCPLILNADDLWPESLYDLGMMKSKLGHTVGDLVARVAYSIVDAIIPISSGYIDTLVGKYRIDPRKIDVIPGGVDLGLFKGQQANEKKSIFDVLYVGAFSKAYDFDQVLSAARLLAGTPEIRFVFQGSGELTPHVKLVAARLSLTNVTVLDSVISREEAAKMMLRSDALVVPLAGTENVEKGISSKIYEYQAAGKPVICCSRGAAAKYITSTQSGIVVEPGDFNSLAVAVTYLYKNRTKAHEMGERGQRIVSGKYSVESVGGALISVADSLKGRNLS